MDVLEIQETNNWRYVMNDLLEILNRAKRVNNFKTQDDFIKYLHIIKEFDQSLKLDWDDGAGEEWARFVHENHGIVYMINSKIGIIFARESYKEEIPNVLFSECVIYITESFDKDEWFIDMKKLETQIPQIKWHASEDAVNSNKFSLSDLYFATV